VEITINSSKATIVINPDFILFTNITRENISHSWYGSGWLEWDGRIVNQKLISTLVDQNKNLYDGIRQLEIDIQILDNKMDNLSNRSKDVNKLINEKTAIINFLRKQFFNYNEYIDIISYYCENISASNYDLEYLKRNLNSKIYNPVHIQEIVQWNKYLDIKLIKRIQKPEIDDL